MKVYDIRSEQQDGIALVSATVEPANADAVEVWFRIDGVDQAPTSIAEALTVGLLAPCMHDQEALKVYGALSWTLARNLEAAQDVLTAWYPRLTPVDVLASQFTRLWRGIERGTGSACCFTAGVNSWYSLLKHDARITHLLLVRGFDAALDTDEAWHGARARVGLVAKRLGKRLVTCETNLRHVADRRRGHASAPNNDFWNEYLHGSVLAAVGLLLQREVGELIVPAVHTFGRLKPWGSSPLLDPLWSSDRLRILHDGCEASRADKVAYIASSDPALESHHVCDRSAANCGRCDKCLDTLSALQAAGALRRASTFPRPPSLPAASTDGAAIELPEASADAITIPHAVAVARYVARVLGPRPAEDDRPGTIGMLRRVED